MRPLAGPGQAGEVDVVLHVAPGCVGLLAGHQEDHRDGLHQPLLDLGVQLLALLLAGARPRLVEPGVHVCVLQLQILPPERLAVEEAPEEVRVGVGGDDSLDDDVELALDRLLLGGREVEQRQLGVHADRLQAGLDRHGRVLVHRERGVREDGGLEPVREAGLGQAASSLASGS